MSEHLLVVKLERGTCLKQQRMEGAGLGLAIVNQMMTLHGGRLAIKSQPGKGTCVAVAMPRLELSSGQQAKLSA